MAKLANVGRLLRDVMVRQKLIILLFVRAYESEKPAAASPDRERNSGGQQRQDFVKVEVSLRRFSSRFSRCRVFYQQEENESRSALSFCNRASYAVKQVSSCDAPQGSALRADVEEHLLEWLKRTASRFRGACTVAALCWAHEQVNLLVCLQRSASIWVPTAGGPERWGHRRKQMVGSCLCHLHGPLTR